MAKEEILFRKRFVKDFNLPIQLVESPFFEYYIEKYDFFPTDDLKCCRNIIQNKFNGDINNWLYNYSNIRDTIITTIENSDSYKRFLNIDLKDYNYEKNNVSESNVYNESNVGKFFVSIDLKKANFQTLKFIDKSIVMGCDTYDEFIDYFNGDDYFKKSKYTRQVIFGKLNPKRTIFFEKFLINSILKNENNLSLKSLLNKSTLYSVSCDEIILLLGDNVNVLNNDILSLVDKIHSEVLTNHGLLTSIELFKLGTIRCVNHNNNIVDGYIKYNCLNNESRLKGVSNIFFPQVYSYFKNIPIDEKDLYFSAENQIAKFCNKLELLEIK